MNKLEYIVHTQKINKLKTKKDILPLMRAGVYDPKYEDSTETKLYKFALTSLLFKKYGIKKELLPALLKRPYYMSIGGITRHLVKDTASLAQVIEATKYTESLYIKCPSIKDLLIFNRIVKDYVFPQGICISNTVTSKDQYINGIPEVESILVKIPNLPLLDIDIVKVYNSNNYAIGEIRGELSRETVVNTMNYSTHNLFTMYVELILNRKQLDQSVYYTYYDGIIDKLEKHYSFTKTQVRQIFQNEIDKII